MLTQNEMFGFLKENLSSHSVEIQENKIIAKRLINSRSFASFKLTFKKNGTVSLLTTGGRTLNYSDVNDLFCVMGSFSSLKERYNLEESQSVQEVTQTEEVDMEQLTIDTYKAEKGENFRMDYVKEYVIPMVKKFINKEVNNLSELKVSGYVPIWDTRNNSIVKKVLEQLLNIKLTGVTKKDKEVLQSYLG